MSRFYNPNTNPYGTDPRELPYDANTNPYGVRPVAPVASTERPAPRMPANYNANTNPYSVDRRDLPYNANTNPYGKRPGPVGSYGPLPPAGLQVSENSIVPIRATPERPGNMAFQRAYPSGIQDRPMAGFREQPQYISERPIPALNPLITQRPTSRPYAMVPSAVPEQQNAQPRLPQQVTQSPLVAGTNTESVRPAMAPVTPYTGPQPNSRPAQGQAQIGDVPEARMDAEWNRRYEASRRGIPGLDNSIDDQQRGEMLNRRVSAYGGPFGGQIPWDEAADVMIGRGDTPSSRTMIPAASITGLSQNRQELLQGDRRIYYGPTGDQEGPAVPVIPLDRRPNADIYLQQLRDANQPAGTPRTDGFTQQRADYIPARPETLETRQAESDKSFRDRQDAKTGFREQNRQSDIQAGERRAAALESRMATPNRDAYRARQQAKRADADRTAAQQRQEVEDQRTAAESSALVDKTKAEAEALRRPPESKSRPRQTRGEAFVEWSKANAQGMQEVTPEMVDRFLADYDRANAEPATPTSTSSSGPIDITDRASANRVDQNSRNIMNSNAIPNAQGFPARPNQRAITALRQNPALREMFDKEFGAGSSNMYLAPPTQR